MSQQKLLKQVIKTLNQTGIQYMLTGFVFLMFLGHPRSTHDIDMVIAIEKSKNNIWSVNEEQEYHEEK